MRTPSTAGMRIPRRYKCSRNICGKEFVKVLVTLATKCIRCASTAYDMEYDPEEERLDWISERYERWAQYPQLHIEHIRSRTIEGGKTVVRNKRGLIVDRNLDDRIPVKEGVRG